MRRQIKVTATRAHQIRNQEQGRARKRRVDDIVQGGGDTFGCEQRNRDHHHAHRADDRKRDQTVQFARGQNADHPDGQGHQCSGQQPDAKQARRRLKLGREDHGVDADDGIGADLGHDRKQGRHRRGGLGIAGRQPEMQGHDCRLDRKDQQQQNRRDADACGFLGADPLDPHGEVRHVQRSRLGIERAECKQEQGRADQVEQNILHARAQTLVPARMDHQTIGRDQQDFEEHKQVKDVTCQEGAQNPHQLELEQGVEIATAFVPVRPDGIEQDKQGQNGGQQHHQRRQTVPDQNDAKGRGPVAEAVIDDRSVGHLPHQTGRQTDQGKHTCHGKDALNPDMIPRSQHDERGQKRRQNNRKNDPVGHLRTSEPVASIGSSTWSSSEPR